MENKMIEGLLKLANHLDNKGYRDEASMLDAVISKIAGEPDLGKEYSDKQKEELNKHLNEELQNTKLEPTPPPGHKDNEALDMHEGHDHENHAVDYVEDMSQENEACDKKHHSEDMLAGAFSVHEASKVRRGGW